MVGLERKQIMAKLTIDEDQFDISNTRVVIEDGKILLGNKEYEISELAGTRVHMNVSPHGVAIRTSERHEKTS
jgi:hypothetical protein